MIKRANVYSEVCTTNTFINFTPITFNEKVDHMETSWLSSNSPLKMGMCLNLNNFALHNHNGLDLANIIL